MAFAVGSAISLIGLLIRAWAAGHIRKAEVLAVTGPYAHTRNPLYLGSFFMALGFSIAAGIWWLIALMCIFFIGIYFPVMRIESDDMRRIFRTEYDEYAENVPMLIPRFTAWRRTNVKFDFRLYLRYREYRAAIGVALGMAVLALKAIIVA